MKMQISKSQLHLIRGYNYKNLKNVNRFPILNKMRGSKTLVRENTRHQMEHKKTSQHGRRCTVVTT